MKDYVLMQLKLNKDVDGVTSLGFGKMTMLEKAYGSCTLMEL